jgi:hypothetical protein
LYAFTAFLSLASLLSANRTVCGGQIDYNLRCSKVECNQGVFECYTDTPQDWKCAMCDLTIPAADDKTVAAGEKLTTGAELPDGCRGILREDGKLVVIDDKAHTILYFAPKAAWDKDLKLKVPKKEREAMKKAEAELAKTASIKKAASTKGKAVGLAKRQDTILPIPVILAMGAFITVCTIIVYPFFLVQNVIAHAVNWASVATGGKEVMKPKEFWFW